MDDKLNNIIKLYATHKVAELEKPDAGILFEKNLNISYQDLLADPLFKKPQ